MGSKVCQLITQFIVADGQGQVQESKQGHVAQ